MSISAEHGEISCLFEFPSICGYERDFSFSQTTQWMFVNYGTAISEYIRHPIHYPSKSTLLNKLS